MDTGVKFSHMDLYIVKIINYRNTRRNTPAPCHVFTAVCILFLLAAPAACFCLCSLSNTLFYDTISAISTYFQVFKAPKTQF